MVGPTRWGCLFVLLAAGAGSRAARGEPPAGPAATGSLHEVAIRFEPALPEVGRLLVTHESGWTFRGEALPSGGAIHMPEGPANLTLWVGDVRYGCPIKVPAAATEVVVRWRSGS